MTTQTHSTSSTASQSKFERRREALAIHKAEVDAANKAHRAALNAANAKYQATLAAIGKQTTCTHEHVHIIDEWGDAEGGWTIFVKCDDCGEELQQSAHF